MILEFGVISPIPIDREKPGGAGKNANPVLLES